MTTLDLEIVKGATFGPIKITCKDEAGAAIDLTGWSAYAEVRKTAEKATVLLDFAPILDTDAHLGVVTIPAIAWATTAALPEFSAVWDLILQDTSGNRLPPFIGGAVTVTLPVTQHGA